MKTVTKLLWRILKTNYRNRLWNIKEKLNNALKTDFQRLFLEKVQIYESLLKYQSEFTKKNI